jgi:hypothetical protein
MNQMSERLHNIILINGRQVEFWYVAAIPQKSNVLCDTHVPASSLKSTVICDTPYVMIQWQLLNAQVRTFE